MYSLLRYSCGPLIQESIADIRCAARRHPEQPGKQNEKISGAFIYLYLALFGFISLYWEWGGGGTLTIFHWSGCADESPPRCAIDRPFASHADKLASITKHSQVISVFTTEKRWFQRDTRFREDFFCHGLHGLHGWRPDAIFVLLCRD